MTAIDLVDSTWVSAPAHQVATLMADPARWSRWWPGLTLHSPVNRGDEGVLWQVGGVAEADGVDLGGEAEVWLQPSLDGVTAHFFLRVDPREPAGAEVTPRLRQRIVHHYRTRAKQVFWAIADELDTGRTRRLTTSSPPGGPTPRAG